MDVLSQVRDVNIVSLPKQAITSVDTDHLGLSCACTNHHCKGNADPIPLLPRSTEESTCQVLQCRLKTSSYQGILQDSSKRFWLLSHSTNCTEQLPSFHPFCSKLAIFVFSKPHPVCHFNKSLSNTYTYTLTRVFFNWVPWDPAS